jgi:bifunctional UDP-N-acetylglucosamine pyrophosphorylase / glucosamine-1-phosphate N-acetyltransferase
MAQPSLGIIVLAAGKGTRMKSSLFKVMHKIANRAMVDLVIDLGESLNPQQICVVISEKMQNLTANIRKQHPDSNLKFVVQQNQLGTADAVKSGLSAFDKIPDIILVLYGDTPLLQQNTLENMLQNLEQGGHAAMVLGFDCLKENKYGHLVAKNGGKGNEIDKIVEFKDANEQERQITLCNSGVMAISGNHIQNLLEKVNNDNASGEFYLTDIIALAKEQNLSSGFVKTDEDEVMGVNSRVELGQAESLKQQQIATQMMASGVTLIDSKSVYFSFDTKIGADVVIESNVFFGPDVKVEDNVQIKAFSHIEGAKIKSGASIGPFARVRPQTIIENDAKIGNFVEIKKSTIAKGAKISHLSYVGDAKIGENVNIGAGTITCNYDGYEKFTTNIGAESFVGASSTLIAPVNVGENSIIAAGSVISKDVAEDDLAICREKQRNLKNGGKKYHQKRSKTP